MDHPDPYDATRSARPDRRPQRRPTGPSTSTAPRPTSATKSPARPRRATSAHPHGLDRLVTPPAPTNSTSPKPSSSNTPAHSTPPSSGSKPACHPRPDGSPRDVRVQLLCPPRAAVGGQQLQERGRRRRPPGRARRRRSRCPGDSSSSATTGLVAVCQTTHWWPYSCMVHSLLTTRQRYVERGAAVLALAGHPQTRAGLALHPRPHGGRVRQHGGHHVTGADLDALDPHLLGLVEAEGVGAP